MNSSLSLATIIPQSTGCLEIMSITALILPTSQILYTRNPAAGSLHSGGVAVRTISSRFYSMEGACPCLLIYPKGWVGQIYDLMAAALSLNSAKWLNGAAEGDSFPSCRRQAGRY